MAQRGAGAGARTAAAAAGAQGGGVVHAGQDAQGRTGGGAALQRVAEGLCVPGGGQRRTGSRAVPAQHARTTGTGAGGTLPRHPPAPSLLPCLKGQARRRCTHSHMQVYWLNASEA
jgi:hypothetical protein